MKRLRILITNNTLASRAGSEVYARDLALALLAHGHFPILFSTVLGDVAEELRLATIPVVDDLAKIAQAPDLIHGQHHLETMTALLHFPGVPAVYFCHGWLPWEEAAPVFPSIRRYVAVDDLCFERLNYVSGIAASQIRTIRNAVDMHAFLPREVLPARPKAALVFSNHPAQSPALDVIRGACLAYGIERVDTIGAVANNSVARPQELLGNYDLVFAKGRSALEALAVGCAVIVCDMGRLGEMVTSENVEGLRCLNFGVRTIQQPLTQAGLAHQLSRYQAGDMIKVERHIRETAGFDMFFKQILALYDEVLTDIWQLDLPEQSRAASVYIRDIRMILQRSYQYSQQQIQQVAAAAIDRGCLNAEVAGLKDEKNRLQDEKNSLQDEKNYLQDEKNNLRADLAKANDECVSLKQDNAKQHLAYELLQSQWRDLQKSRSWRVAKKLSQTWGMVRGAKH